MTPETWDNSDPDIAALTGRSRSKLSIKAVWPQLLAIAGVTFVTAYYVPMHRAHQTLTKQHVVAAQQTGQLGGQLAQTQKQLQAADEQRNALAARVDAIDSDAARQARALESLEERVNTGLAKLIKAGSAQVQSAEGGLAVTIDAGQIFVPNKFEVAPKGKDLLCDVARVAGEGTLRVSAPTAPGERPPATLRQVLRTPWSIGAMRAATVADHLTQSCKVPIGRIEGAGAVVVGKGGQRPSIQIDISPSRG